jgi:hypothetical protein
LLATSVWRTRRIVPGGEHLANPIDYRLQGNPGQPGNLHERFAHEALDFIFADRKNLRVDGIGVFDFGHE